MDKKEISILDFTDERNDRFMLQMMSDISKNEEQNDPELYRARKDFWTSTLSNFEKNTTKAIYTDNELKELLHYDKLTSNSLKAFIPHSTFENYDKLLNLSFFAKVRNFFFGKSEQKFFSPNFLNKIADKNPECVLIYQLESPVLLSYFKRIGYKLAPDQEPRGAVKGFDGEEALIVNLYSINYNLDQQIEKLVERENSYRDKAKMNLKQNREAAKYYLRQKKIISDELQKLFKNAEKINILLFDFKNAKNNSELLDLFKKAEKALNEINPSIEEAQSLMDSLDESSTNVKAVSDILGQQDETVDDIANELEALQVEIEPIRETVDSSSEEEVATHDGLIPA